MLSQSGSCFNHLKDAGRAGRRLHVHGAAVDLWLLLKHTCALDTVVFEVVQLFISIFYFTLFYLPPASRGSLVFILSLLLRLFSLLPSC